MSAIAKGLDYGEVMALVHFARGVLSDPDPDVHGEELIAACRKMDLNYTEMIAAALTDDGVS